MHFGEFTRSPRRAIRVRLDDTMLQAYVPFCRSLGGGESYDCILVGFSDSQSNVDSSLASRRRARFLSVSGLVRFL